MREVVVTGIGIVSSLGNNIQEVTESLSNLESGISKNEINAELAQYQHVTDWVWCQEEPMNQGAWYCSQHRFYASIPQGATLTYAGRDASASPAVGYISVHNQQQKQLVDDALTIK